MPSPAPSKKRRRPPLACVQCRRRKVKCDQLRPCTNCTKSRIPDCTFPETEIPGSIWHLSDSPAPKNPRLEPPRATSPDSTSLHPPSLQDYGHQRDLLQEPAVPDRTSSSITSSMVLSPAGRPSHDDTLRQRINELEATVRQLSSGDNTTQSSSLAPTPASAGNDTSRLKFGNQSTWINGTSLFAHILQPLGQAQTKESPLRDSITNFKALGGQVDQHTTVTSPPVVTGSRIPERSLADEFVQGYFAYFEGWLRVLHVPTFRAEYEKFWQRQDKVSETFILLVQVCMGLGITAHRDCLQWRNSASQWLFEGRRWLQGSFEKMNRKPVFEELQLACLILIAEANASENDQMHQCWVSSGSLIRQSMCLGLHREPRHSPGLSVMEVEMRRRIWATVLELNLLLSLQAGQATLITTSHYDTYPPSNMMDEELSDRPDDSGSPEWPGWAKIQVGTAQQLALFNSFNLRSDLVDKINGIGQVMSYDEVLRFHEELSRAKGRMQQNFKASHTKTTTDSTHNAIANIILSRYLLALHLPVLGRSIRNPTFHFSRRLCIATSIEMIKISGIRNSQSSGQTSNIFVETPLQRLFINSPGLFRHIAVQPIFAIALELVTSKEEEYEDRSVFPVWDDAELIQCLKAAETWGANRLQAGITDHRVYCFIGACIAYANALDARAPELELGNVVVGAALRNADNCSTLMRGVAEKLGLLTNQGNILSAGSLTTALPNVTDLTMDLTSSFFGVGMDGFAFDWTYPLDLGLNLTPGTDIGSTPL